MREQHPVRVVQDTPYPAVSYDGIFMMGFKKGLTGLDAEARRRAEATEVPDEDKFAQGPTDWGVEAVVDEDQL